ncbi:MAG: hypothetical protein P8129_13660 [Anaerolineae bacterium]
MNKRSLVVVLAVACVALLSVGSAWAQTPPTEAPTAAAITPTPTPQIPSPSAIADAVVEDLGGKEAVLFAWYPDDWGQGALLFVLGLAGALVTVYLFVGEMLPSMGGQAEYERLRVTLAHYVERREEIIEMRNNLVLGEEDQALSLEALSTLSRDLQEMTELLERRLRSERWRLFAIGFPIYLVLGGLFAAAFASNLLEAIVIGFGWTLIADRLGLERKNAQLQEIRAQEINELKNEAQEAKAKADVRIAGYQAKLESKEEAIKQSSQQLMELATVREHLEDLVREANEYKGSLDTIQNVAGLMAKRLDDDLDTLRDLSQPLDPTDAERIANEIETEVGQLLTIIQESLKE